ncbi:MAG TPA: protein phosphatase 2C domain-containing protein [Ktedonobacterales bacterium]|nr:protein phosphatase 2C domain-containing protein [Ktedonobacterales bacterium]
MILTEDRGIGVDDGASSLAASFRWVGSDEDFLDRPALAVCGSVVIGCYGVRTAAGASKNEDGALVWCEVTGAWELAVLLDAHYSAESAELILATLEAERERLLAALALPVEIAFHTLQKTLLAIFSDEAFRARCRQVYGETSCLIVARKGAYLWWFSVGDCLAYFLHPETARLGEYLLNQRVFFQWIGQRNTFDEPVPCYATGTQRLHPGDALIALSTDGVFEAIPVFYDEPAQLLWLLDGEEQLTDGVRRILEAVHNAQGRDSATLIAWRVRGG